MKAFKSVVIGSAALVIMAVGAPAAQAVPAASYATAGATDDAAASTDWSGWDVTGGTYSKVSASWTVPTVTCTTGETSYSADWVGLDGDGSSSVEQTGTSSDCDSGTPRYSAWYEFYPSVAVTLDDKVKAGDKISASVQAVAGTDEFKLVLTDSTQKWTETKTAESPDGTGASAEIIAEAPSGSERAGSVLPLADFKTVTFTDVLVDGKNLGDSSGAAKIAMVDSAGNAMATVSALTGANKFTVTWVSSGDGLSAEQTSGRGSGQGSVGGGWPYSDGSGLPGAGGGWGGWGDSGSTGTTGSTGTDGLTGGDGLTGDPWSTGGLGGGWGEGYGFAGGDGSGDYWQS